MERKQNYCNGLTERIHHIIDKPYNYGLTVFEGKIAAFFYGSYIWQSKVSLDEREWTYICVTCNGDTIRLYINGLPADSAKYSKGTKNNSYDLGIGNSPLATHNVPFCGKIDMVRIY
ncbi:MAG: LamG domain-containing protein [Fibrobacter sp.]|nr:LamG domain-containing protein [Fibrobacter sp.]